MPDYVITYDIRKGEKNPHRELALSAEKESLLYVWKGSTKVLRLPNTTLWGVFEDGESARKAFDRALKKAGEKVGYEIKLEKRFTAQITDLSVRSDVSLFETSRGVRPLVVSGDRQVATAAMALGANLENGVVRLEPGKTVSVAFLLSDDTVPSVRIQVLDAETDAVLYASPSDLPLKLGV